LSQEEFALISQLQWVSDSNILEHHLNAGSFFILVKRSNLGLAGSCK
jgi:hypothetical protein